MLRYTACNDVSFELVVKGLVISKALEGLSLSRSYLSHCDLGADTGRAQASCLFPGLPLPCLAHSCEPLPCHPVRRNVLSTGMTLLLASSASASRTIR